MYLDALKLNTSEKKCCVAVFISMCVEASISVSCMAIRRRKFELSLKTNIFTKGVQKKDYGLKISSSGSELHCASFLSFHLAGVNYESGS